MCKWCLYFMTMKIKLIQSNADLVGLSIHTFHGNFFVRSTDLLSLPNVNPDAGYAVQMSVEESLTDMQVVSFQSALLYTSSKGKIYRQFSCINNTVFRWVFLCLFISCNSVAVTYTNCFTQYQDHSCDGLLHVVDVIVSSRPISFFGNLVLVWK